ncbi:MAG: hypothetical protein RIS29_1124 [Bacteroidota bacterium]|jgi:outer membrane protein OmpA-like peptidoglycan-associated protein
MKKYNILTLFIAVLLMCQNINSNAQQSRTMYFMDNVPMRSYLNPSFQPYSDFYLSLPVIGYTSISLGNNSVSMKDLIYNHNGNPIWALNKNGDVDKLFNAFRSNTLINAETQINLLSFGFRSGRSYWSFTLNERASMYSNLPKNLIQFGLYGTPDINGQTYNFKNAGFDVSAFTEAGLGYATALNERIDFGAKLKFLYGSANVSTDIKNMTVQAYSDYWNLLANGNLRAALPVVVDMDNPDGKYITEPASNSDYLKQAGLGGAIDLGVTYKFADNLKFSAALVDLGTIRWNKLSSTKSMSIDYNYYGVKGSLLNMSDHVADSLTNTLKDALKDTVYKNKAYSTYLTPKINIGGEYSVLNNKLSFGLLSTTSIFRSTAFEEITASVNGRPLEWFNLSASYSIMNGRTSNIGAGLGLRTGILHWFLAADYIPLKYTASYPVTSGFKTPLPYNTKALNLSFGFNIVIGNRKDADDDGVIDRVDKCPETPFSVVVDRKGCPVDTDGDGVPDYLDKCPGTPPEAYNRINQNGCPIDTDGDGIPDYLDKCPDTPADAIQYVDSTGCLVDADQDGVLDYKDKCLKTPLGVKVDSLGCPLDTDLDGVADYLDKCPNTPAEARNMVDSVGCPYDKDRDGVLDYLDLCPNTPAEARLHVDKNGCTLDTDQDGVPDYLDKCPNTPLEAKGTIDENGCPRDTDGDGVLDYQDNCPKVPGVASNHGCPEIKKEVKALFKKALQGIQFETGKYVIKPVSFTILNQVANVLIENPTYLVEVQGHTDNVGKPDANMILSDNRAKAVKDYLINKGVDASRMTSKGYGDTMPVATNKTAAGKTLNRRVEFVVTFEETVPQ